MRWLMGIFIVAIALAFGLAASGQESEDGGESFASVFFFSHQTDSSGERHLEPVGTAMTWLLFAMSMFNFGLIIRLALANQRKAIVPSGLVAEVKRLAGGGDYRKVLEITSNDESFFSRLANSSLSQASQGFAAMVRTMENSADLLITARMRPVEVLYMFGQISPMMGLLGTVYGIIHAFLAFVSSGGNASPVLLAGGIGTALVATFWGLIVAIPALAGYALIRNKINQLTLEGVNEVEEILNNLRQRPAVPPVPRPAPVPAPVPAAPQPAAAARS